MTRRRWQLLAYCIAKLLSQCPVSLIPTCRRCRSFGPWHWPDRSRKMWPVPLPCGVGPTLTPLPHALPRTKSVYSHTSPWRRYPPPVRGELKRWGREGHGRSGWRGGWSVRSTCRGAAWPDMKEKRAHGKERTGWGRGDDKIAAGRGGGRRGPQMWVLFKIVSDENFGSEKLVKETGSDDKFHYQWFPPCATLFLSNRQW
jgi:hypothetical protein